MCKYCENYNTPYPELKCKDVVLSNSTYMNIDDVLSNSTYMNIDDDREWQRTVDASELLSALWEEIRK